jgi:hypothetical protein
MELQVSIIDGKLMPQRYPMAMAQTDTDERIWHLGLAPDSTGAAGACV